MPARRPGRSREGKTRWRPRRARLDRGQADSWRRRHRVSSPALCTALRVLDPPSILPGPRDESEAAGRGQEDPRRCLFPPRPPPGT
ncbi:hypothetical protein NDU88_005934 [Pleurodeles waltl]|uniref:Uncharacterized protein n=1 Tax=Pleurodeles waltl TaxID=8319 RepID=A0AAV7RN65_PLEWA|nr:hypothetical protein NDU88_005934 [Pleurodeles waltl]